MSSLLGPIISHLAAATPPVTSPIHPVGLPQTGAGSGNLQTIISIALNIIGALALLMIAISGLRYILAGGDSQKTAQAKDGIIAALAGLAVAIAAQAIVYFVVRQL